jgi:hypothetical protein
MDRNLELVINGSYLMVADRYVVGLDNCVLRLDGNLSMQVLRNEPVADVVPMPLALFQHLQKN